MKRQNSSQGPTWLVLLTVISTATAVILLSRDTSALSGTDSGITSIEDRSYVQAFPIVIRPGMGAMALVDQKHQTISIYQYRPSGIQGELVFLAARCYKYDVQLQEYNSGDPRPDVIKALLEKASQTDKTPKSPPTGPDTPQKK